ncbi:MAG: hypothetical protein [Circular genetic element sp.]|nr:MAG: hypothetical protein [Circular genetic element sp.]
MALSPLLYLPLAVYIRHEDSVFKIESGYWFRPEYKSKDFLESVGSTLCDSTRYFVPALFAHLSQLRQCAFFYSNCVGTLPYIEFDLRRLALPSSRYPPCDHHLTSVMC